MVTKNFETVSNGKLENSRLFICSYLEKHTIHTGNSSFIVTNIKLNLFKFIPSQIRTSFSAEKILQFDEYIQSDKHVNIYWQLRRRGRREDGQRNLYRPGENVYIHIITLFFNSFIMLNLLLLY